MRFVFSFFIILLSVENFSSDGPIITIDKQIETDFGIYNPFPVNVTPSVEPYTIEEDLSNVSNKELFSLNEEQKELLIKNGFFVTPSSSLSYGTGYNEMYDIYLEAEEKGLPIFVTSDVMLHTYHRLFDWILQKEEENYFFNYLKELDDRIYQKAIELDESLGTISTFILTSYFLVPLKILNPEFSIPSKYKDVVEAELNLIENHQGIARSPIFAFDIDYSHFKVRGHYTKTENLKKYFKAMMWHGKVAFCLKDFFGNPLYDITGSALLLTKIFYNENLFDLWNLIYRPTTFFVGEADDALVFDYLKIAKEVYGENFLSLNLEEVLNVEKIDIFIEKAEEEFPEPQVRDILGKGLRFMGQRFIPDSYIFTKLTFPEVEDRYMPKGLDVMSVLGSDLAFEILEEIGETNYPNYINQMEYLKNLFLNYPEEKWVENLYLNWLYTLMPLLYQKDTGFPFFMKNTEWRKKDLNTALGSWTELRHDTILYAKQSTSGYGDIIYYFPLLSYVEPNPYIFSRLASLCLYTQEGLNNLKVLDGVQNSKLTNLFYLLINLKNISEKELTNKPLTMDEWNILANFGSIIKEIVSEPAEDPFADYLEDEPIPIIADVHTDPNTLNCLEEGVGFPQKIFVVVPQNGKLYITVGAVFSYYEFIQPITDRLNDEEWREILKSSNPPLPPEWTESFRDSSSFYNPNPKPAYLTKIFKKVEIKYQKELDKLYLYVSIPPEDITVQAYLNNNPLQILDFYSKDNGTEFIFQIPSNENIKIILWLYGYNGLFEELLELDLTKGKHSRPF